ncbi:4-hydroxythreonine-4-phosphate dehydrogenase PdxA [Algoriphagus boritolerans]
MVYWVKRRKKIIKPAIKELKDQNKYIFGPYPADGFFWNDASTKV